MSNQGVREPSDLVSSRVLLAVQILPVSGLELTQLCQELGPHHNISILQLTATLHGPH